VGEERLEPGEVAVLRGCVEAAGELLLLLSGGLEPRASSWTWLRARLASWRTLSGLLPMISAIRA
jgi:hypothetical protein